MKKYLKLLFAIQLIVLFNSAVVCAQSWLDPVWSYRESINITNPGGRLLSDFQVHVTLDSSFDFTRARSDGSDVRFTAEDGVTLIPFWTEAWDANNGVASLWVKVPLIEAQGARIYMYHGYPDAVNASNGTATFEFFDDFPLGSETTLGYYDLGQPQTVLAKDQSWESLAPHTLSVAKVDTEDFTYFGYYGLIDGCGGVGVAGSNDLSVWYKYPGNPLFTDGRWPSVLKVGTAFYMLYEKDYCGTSYIKLATSTDGINFIDLKTIVQQQPGFRNQNPNLFYNPNDGKYYIYWFKGGGSPAYTIRARSATSIENLDDVSSETVVLQSNDTLAAPNMLFHDGRYFLATEALDGNGQWQVLIYSSTSPLTGFSLLPGNPVLNKGAACFFQHVFDTNLHGYYCQQRSGTGTVDHCTADLSAGRVKFGNEGLDPTKWRATGGSWGIISATQQDGSIGGVAEGTNGSDLPQMLLSSYRGGDYVVEAYGNLTSGRVWGIGVGAVDQANLCSISLYEDLDSTYNLYVYDWVNGNANAVNRTAVGTVDPNRWYKLSVKVHGSTIDVYKDNTLVLQSSSSQNISGAMAIYGEQGTVAQFNNVLVRKYADTEPVASLGSVLLPALTSASLSPAQVAGGNPSQVSLTLSAPAPAGGVVVSLSSSNTSAATVPSTITIPAGSTGATFMVSTVPVSSPISVTISSNYGESTKTCDLTILTTSLASLSLNPSSLAGGNTSQGTVTLASPAPAGGVVVSLSSSNTSAATVPSTMTIPAGSTGAMFTVSTRSVSRNALVTIAAMYAGVRKTAILNVRG